MGQAPVIKCASLSAGDTCHQTSRGTNQEVNARSAADPELLWSPTHHVIVVVQVVPHVHFAVPARGVDRVRATLCGAGQARATHWHFRGPAVCSDPADPNLREGHVSGANCQPVNHPTAGTGWSPSVNQTCEGFSRKVNRVTVQS